MPPLEEYQVMVRSHQAPFTIDINGIWVVKYYVQHVPSW